MRRAAALAFALAALLATVALVAFGYACGAKSVSDSCFGAEECDAKAECRSYVHPFAPLYLAFSAVALVGAHRGLPLLPLGAGVVGAGLGTLAGFSLGLWGIGISLLLVAAGLLSLDRAARRSPVGWAALLAAILPVPLLMLVILLAPTGIPLAFVWILVLGPALAWGMLAAATQTGTS